MEVVVMVGMFLLCLQCCPVLPELVQFFQITSLMTNTSGATVADRVVRVRMNQQMCCQLQPRMQTATRALASYFPGIYSAIVFRAGLSTEAHTAIQQGIAQITQST